MYSPGCTRCLGAAVPHGSVHAAERTRFRHLTLHYTCAQVYEVFGLQYRMALSTRPEKYMGELDQWSKAEAALEQALNATGEDWEVRGLVNGSRNAEAGRSGFRRAEAEAALEQANR